MKYLYDLSACHPHIRNLISLHATHNRCVLDVISYQILIEETLCFLFLDHDATLSNFIESRELLSTYGLPSEVQSEILDELITMMKTSLQHAVSIAQNPCKVSWSLSGHGTLTLDIESSIPYVAHLDELTTQDGSFIPERIRARLGL